MAEKSTLPWLDQYPGWLSLALMSPYGENAFRAAKPKMFKQVFPDGIGPEADITRRYTQEYNPFAFLTQALGRPGGASTGDKQLMDQSYFGAGAQYDPSGMFKSILQNVPQHDAGGYATNIFKSLMGGTPGLEQTQQRMLQPGSIFNAVKRQRGGG